MTADARPLSLAALLAVAAVLSAVTPLARAESGPPPDSGVADCTYDMGAESAPPAGDVPSNWPVFETFARFAPDESDMRIVRVADGVPLSTTPGRPLLQTLYALEDMVVGEDYDLYHPVCAGMAQRVTRYRAVAPVPAPVLGTIEISRLYAANYVRGIANRYHFVDVTLTRDPSVTAAPWSGMSWTIVEADDFGGGAPLEQASVRVAVGCGGRPGLPEDTRTLTAAAFFVRSRVITDAWAPVTWSCDDALRVEPTRLRPLTPAEIAYWDTEAPDAGVVPLDAARRIDGGRMDMDTAPDTDSTCTVAHGQRPAPLALAAALAALGCLARRRAGGIVRARAR